LGVAARLHLDLRFTHVNLARLGVVADKLSMQLIAALQFETILREQSLPGERATGGNRR
jgi:hypothetical protein